MRSFLGDVKENGDGRAAIAEPAGLAQRLIVKAEQPDFIRRERCHGRLADFLGGPHVAFHARDFSAIPEFLAFIDGLCEPLRVHGIGREPVLATRPIKAEDR